MSTDTATRKPKASDRRLAAIEALTRPVWSRILPEGGAEFLLTLDDRKDAGNAIILLRHLGRADRWQAAVKEWAEQVYAAADLDHLRWAFTQYGIYACLAAE